MWKSLLCCKTGIILVNKKLPRAGRQSIESSFFPLLYNLSMAVHWFSYPGWTHRGPPEEPDLNVILHNVLTPAHGSRLPPSGREADYLALAMLCVSLRVSSDASEGTRISTGLILTTRPSNSERDGPSGKESNSMSPVLGWTACMQKPDYY